MIIQNFVLPQAQCYEQAVYLKTKRILRDDEVADVLYIRAGEHIASQSYMNMFDWSFYKKYTHITQIYGYVQVTGRGVVSFYSHENKQNIKLCSMPFNSEAVTELQIEIPDCSGYIYFVLEAETDVVLNKMYYATKESPIQSVDLAVVICTYKRNEMLQENVQQLLNSSFFSENESEYYDKMSVVVVDNASEIIELDNRIEVIWNRNNGGAGGFARGMDYFSCTEKKPTHVILMDDDVLFLNESFYRLYALLAYVHLEYAAEVVAGRMFRLDKPFIQYTASEIWNRGSLEHVGFNLDIRDVENLEDINKGELGEYSGWWFAVFPYEFILNNKPLPFFIHCDDVEYGLRHGGTPIILNGIQVWHETYEYRQNPYILYYDTRNPLFVNEIQYGRNNWKEEWRRILERVAQYKQKGEYLSGYMCLRAFRDYMKGFEWLSNVDGERLHKDLVFRRNREFYKYLNALTWRVMSVYLKVKMKEK